jgi:hypothetical protein
VHEAFGWKGVVVSRSASGSPGEPPLLLVFLGAWVFWPLGLYLAVRRHKGDSAVGRRPPALLGAIFALIAFLATSTFTVVPYVLLTRSG